MLLRENKGELYLLLLSSLMYNTTDPVTQFQHHSESNLPTPVIDSAVPGEVVQRKRWLNLYSANFLLQQDIILAGQKI